MAKGTFSSSSSRTFILTICALLLMLGLGAAGAGRFENERRHEVNTAASYSLTLTALPGGAPSLVRQDGLRSDSACHPGEFADALPGATVRGSSTADQRGYLSKMAALPYQRRSATASALDPYQASLNQSVYLVSDASLPTLDVGASSVALSQTCQIP